MDDMQNTYQGHVFDKVVGPETEMICSYFCWCSSSCIDLAQGLPAHKMVRAFTSRDNILQNKAPISIGEGNVSNICLWSNARMHILYYLLLKRFDMLVSWHVFRYVFDCSPAIVFVCEYLDSVMFIWCMSAANTISVLRSAPRFETISR